MRHPFAWLRAGPALFGFLRRPVSMPVDGPDPRAEDLRRKLAESRAIVEERDDFEAAEPTVDQTEHAPEDPARRRRSVHEAGREMAERMRETR